jgi:MT0933-like antitoxin protein
VGFLDKAKDLLAQNADKVETAIDKAGEFVDEKTKGNYTDAIHKVQEEAKKAAGPGPGPGDKGDQQN